MTSVAVVGSGLAAVSAAKALVRLGLRPTILDRGERLAPEVATRVAELRSKEPSALSAADRAMVMANPSLSDGSPIPKKLVFGSDYFYGSSVAAAPVRGEGPLPPFSYAKGGFSSGWGGAALPPADCDLVEWPVKNAHLGDSYKSVFDFVPYSAADDGLSQVFPRHDVGGRALPLGPGNQLVLEDLRGSGLADPERLVFGQSRLMTRVEGPAGCRRCGMCMSGCVYGSIYKATDTLDELQRDGLVDYRPGIMVQRLDEVGNQVVVTTSAEGENVSEGQPLAFDRVFLAAGAVNSTRIILESLGLYNHPTRLQTRGSFVVPVARLRGLPLDLPDANTQPGLFVELKPNGLADEPWMHVQLSTPNEMLYDKLGVRSGAGGLNQAARRAALGHLLVAFCNMHSSASNDYLLQLDKPQPSEPGILHYQRDLNPTAEQAKSDALRGLNRVLRKIGCYAIGPMARSNPGTYHVGCSMPMRTDPRDPLDTDLLGRPAGLERVHVVDSSVFPSLPGTTIGLLAMANAHRIASDAGALH